nr:hypothetical protein CFP56_30439 [Quercus suber]
MALETRGRFTRICIQVNLANPLIKIIKIGGVEKPVQYEGINSLCFSYGHVGHKVESYSYIARASEKGGEDKAKGDDPVVIDHSTPSEETYGPWVLISRKKQSTRKGYKDSTHAPQFSSAQQLRTRPPNQAKSPPNLKFDPSGPTKRVSKHVARPHSEDSALMADRTTQAEKKDKSNILTAQSSAKHRSWNPRTNQKFRGASSLKGDRLEYSSEEKEPKFGHDFKALFDKLLVFIGGNSSGVTLTFQVEVEMVAKDDEV